MAPVIKDLISRACAVLVLLGVTACSGGGDDGPSVGPPISISTPASGASTTATTITVSGFVTRPDGTFPSGSVSWSNGSSSGAASVQCGFLCCLIWCTGWWEATVPLVVGTNTITASFGGASASVTVVRTPVVTGRVSLQTSGDALVSPEVVVTLTSQGGGFPSTTNLDGSGNYIFGGLLAGSYTLSPQLASVVSPSCLSFSPSSRTVDLTAMDVSGQDFAASQPSACYSIRGRVTNNILGLEVNGIDVFIEDSMGGSLRKVTEGSGSFDFRYLLPGTYTITPRSCISTPCLIFVPATRIVTIVNGDLINQDFVVQF